MFECLALGLDDVGIEGGYVLVEVEEATVVAGLLLLLSMVHKMRTSVMTI